MSTADRDGVEEGKGSAPQQNAEGSQLARAALARARDAAAAVRLDRERAAAAQRRKRTRAANVGDGRRHTEDEGPVPFGAAVEDLLAERGWSGEAAIAAVMADWTRTVGEDVAAHCTPVAIRDGVLTVEAESTAWATQIRLLSRDLLARISQVAGAGAVTRVTVHGPTGPSWRHGRLRVPGRGPRDTYG